MLETIPKSSFVSIRKKMQRGDDLYTQNQIYLCWHSISQIYQSTKGNGYWKLPPPLRTLVNINRSWMSYGGLPGIKEFCLEADWQRTFKGIYHYAPTNGSTTVTRSSEVFLHWQTSLLFSRKIENCFLSLVWVLYNKDNNSFKCTWLQKKRSAYMSHVPRSFVVLRLVRLGAWRASLSSILVKWWSLLKDLREQE